MANDEFMLFDLKIEVIHHEPKARIICQHKVGDVFYVKGSQIEIPDGKQFGLYAMLAVLPFVPAKQRPTQKTDWMTSDAIIGCSDPYCGAGFRITRLDEKTYSHAAHTIVPITGN